MLGSPAGTVSIQFHGMPLEVASFAFGFVGQEPLRATGFLKSGDVAPLDLPTIDRQHAEQAQFKAIAFTAGEPISGFKTMHQFHKLNPDTLVIQIGQHGEAGLGESWLWATARSAESMERWKPIVAQLRKLTVAGAVARNVHTGKTSNLRSHRFTPAAIRVHEQGAELLSLAPNVRMHPSSNAALQRRPPASHE